jgi:5-methyltetrahydrofolate--homocysteine methyltransferase
MYRDQAQRDLARQLRNQPTDAEKRLWHFLRAQKLRGHKFRRQAAIGPYVVDFVCFAVKLIVELDGPQHLEPEAIEHDSRRTEWLASRGFRLIRFRNQELDENIHAVVDSIGSVLSEFEAQQAIPPSPALPAEGREPEGRNEFAEGREPEG